MNLKSIHHVQIAMPLGGDEQARHFYGTLLGLREVPKPPTLAPNGGIWFEEDTLRVHIGPEDPFTPAFKAHTAFVVEDVDAITAHLKKAGVRIIHDENYPGFQRVYVFDPFNNRIELLKEVEKNE